MSHTILRALRPALAAGIVLLAASLSLAQGVQRITPNFKDADITQVIEMVATATGKNFIIDPRVRAQVTMLSATPMTPAEFYQAFQSILSVHDFVAVPSGNVIKIIPSANMRQIPGNDLGERVSSTSDELVTQIVQVKSVSAASLVATLRPLMPQTANLGVITGSNLLIFTDRANNVNRMMRIIQKIDQAGNSDIDVIPLQNATAAETARTLNSLVGVGGGATDGSGTPARIVADDRSNSIFVSGDSAQRLRVKALVAHLDTPVDSGSDTKVRYLDYADAVTLAGKLKEQLSSASTAVNNPNAQNRVIGAVNQAGQPGAQVSAPAGGSATLSLAGGTAVIWADKDTNALIITAPAKTMRAINEVINKLDIRRANVVIDAIIAEVSADNAAQLGVNWAVDGSAANLAAGTFAVPVGSGNPPIVDLYGLAKGTSTTVPTGTLLGVGRLAATGINFGAVLSALRTDTRNNVISQPHVQTQDNQEAKIEVAKEVPFVTGQYTGTTGTTSAFQTIQRQQVGTILTVTPQISKNGTIMLKIQAESSSLDNATTPGAVDLITNKRTISTTVLIEDGGTLVLGGLVQDQAKSSENRVPGLGRIPLIGELFRSRSNSHTKTNLLVFIRPKILHDAHETAIETDAKYNFMREEQADLNRESTVLPLLRMEKGATLPPLDDISRPVGSRPPATPTPAPAPANGATKTPAQTTAPGGTPSGTPPQAATAPVEAAPPASVTRQP